MDVKLYAFRWMRPWFVCIGLGVGVVGIAACGANGEVVGSDLGVVLTNKDAGVDAFVKPPTSPTVDKCAPTYPRTAAPIVSVLPEAGEAPFVDAINQAHSKIRVMIYLMGAGGILNAFKAKAKAGVQVQVILDREHEANKKYYDDLRQANVEVKWSDPKFTHMHAKLIIIDDAQAIISTGNYSKTYSINKERNYVARLTDAEDLTDLVEIFEADWAGRTPQVDCTRLLISPINAKPRLLSLIDSATSSIAIASMQFAERDIRDRIVAQHKSGIAVQVLMADPTWVEANTEAAAFLKAQQIPVRYMNNPPLHVKSILVDGKTAYLGSVNLSWTSVSKNREVGLITNDETAIAPIQNTFDRDWSGATPF